MMMFSSPSPLPIEVGRLEVGAVLALAEAPGTAALVGGALAGGALAGGALAGVPDVPALEQAATIRPTAAVVAISDR